MNEQIAFINYKHDYNNPIITIQRYIRRYIIQKKLKKKNEILKKKPPA